MKYADIIAKIENGMDEKPLNVLMANAEKKLAEGDLEAQQVIDAAAEALVVFAPKTSFSAEIEDTLLKLSKENGWDKLQGNLLDNRVKFSASCLTDKYNGGKCVAGHYVGYKPEGAKTQTLLELFIREKGDAIQAKVLPLNSSEDKATYYANITEAVEHFNNILEKLGAFAES